MTPANDRPFGLPIDHLGVAVHDLDAALGPWSLLGLPTVEDEEVPEQGVRVRLLRAGDAWIELLAPTREDSPVGRFLAKRGEGLHHVALRVDDVEGELARLTDAGARAIDARPRIGRAGSRVAFLHPGWAHGVLVELVQPAPPR
jgi:methylmalonyl-CoA/ethylmalonyl-CoA epimerase